MKMQFPSCFKISNLRHCEIIRFWGGTSLCGTQTLIESEFPYRSDFGRSPREHLGEYGRIDIAAAQDHADPLAAQPGALPHERGQGRGAGPSARLWVAR